jgi:glycine/D-amino acid oxidase-like deaminating enzyme
MLAGAAAVALAAGLSSKRASGAPRVAARAFDGSLPTSVDVVVVGGGIVGVSTALQLALRGVSVAICEKGYVGAEQSSRALGWVRVTGRDPRDIPLNLESRRVWAGLDAATAGQTGYHTPGLLYVASNASELADYESWLSHARSLGVDSIILNAEQAKAHIPATSATVVGALYTAADGCAEPTLATGAIADGARNGGARILTQCAVRGYETKAGRISGVVTEKGPIACQAVLVAGGIWSGLFCGNHDLDLPLLAVGSYLLRTSPLDGPDICVRNGANGLRRNIDGGYTVGSPQELADITPEMFTRFLQFLPALMSRWSMTRLHLGRSFVDAWNTPRHWRLDAQSPFERDRVHEIAPAPWSAAVWRDAVTLYPFLGQGSVIEKWGGMIDVTPDTLPVISAIERVPGLFVAGGFSGGGFGAGPGAGKLAAELITGARPSIDPSPYRYARFFDGSKLTVAH